MKNNFELYVCWGFAILVYFIDGNWESFIAAGFVIAALENKSE